MRALIIVLAFWSTAVSQASTFVGNGGNAGDVELQVTLNQIEKVMGILAQQNSLSGNKLCVCTDEFAGRPWCEMLNKLTLQQRRFCERVIFQKAGELSAMLGQKGRIRFSWTHEPIEVKERGLYRGVDAVTDPQHSLMTLNQPRFLELSDIDRVFLIGHEIFHLTTMEGKPLSDEGDIGPFTGEDGGRQLINSMAAAMVMQASKEDLFQEYRGAVRRSKSYVSNWLTLGYQTQEVGNDPSTAYDITRHTGFKIGYRYQMNQNWGLVGTYTRMTGGKTILDSINADEERRVWGFGAAYRWFPFENPLTFRGQSHFVLSGTVDLVQAKYNLTENPVVIEDSYVTTSYTLSCNYFIPFAGGLWGYGGVEYSDHHYKYEKVGLKQTNNGAIFNLGVSYGF